MHPGDERRVLDASVAAKWHLRDESDVAAADAVLADFVAGNLDLLAPSHLRYELLNTIAVARQRGRITPETADVAAVDALALLSSLTLHDEDALLLRGSALAAEQGCAFYDGVYAALAEAAACPLLLADDALVRRLQGSGVQVERLADYVPRTAPFDGASPV